MGSSRTVGTLYRYELKMLLRDRRTIFFSVVLPLLLLPGLFFVMRTTEDRAEERRENRVYAFAIAGSRPVFARQVIADALALPPEEDSVASGVRFHEVRPADPDSALAAGDIAFVVEALGPEEASAIRDSMTAAFREEVQRGETRGPEAEAVAEALAALAEGPRPGVPLLRLQFRGDSNSSDAGSALLRDRLERLREVRRDELFQVRGLPVAPDEVGVVELHEAASAERESNAQLAVWLTPLLIMLMLSGGSVVAADAISGEKERGTLETLLTTSATRAEIVSAKQFVIITVGVAITVINVANLALYLGLGLFELPEQFVISVQPLAFLVLLLLFLPLTVLISSVLLMLSGYSSSYKEYQVYFFPVLLVFLIPSMAAVLPGVELASVMAVIPIANISLAVRDVLVGEYPWVALGATILTTTGLALWLARMTERSLSTEKLITAAETDEADLIGGEPLFRRRVLRWFAVLWVVFFLSSVSFLGQFGIRVQIGYNIVGLFLGGTILMIWRYRLDPRRALALRLPKPAVWLGVLLGAPSAFIVGIGVGQLGRLVFPIPEEMIEAFGQFLLPEHLPLWQIVLFLAVLPGIIEEMAFRGVLLYGLRERFRPVLLAVVVGLVFGIFHVDLFRLFPTTYLGIILAGVTLMTGSIFPAMLWHTLNNSVALVPEYLGWWHPETTVPAWLYAAALAALAAALTLIWKNRTPYPGLRPAGRGRAAAEQAQHAGAAPGAEPSGAATRD